MNSGPIVKWWTQYEIVDADEIEQYGQYIKNEVDIEDAAYNSKRSTVQYIFHEVHYGTQLTGHGKVHTYFAGHSREQKSLETALQTVHWTQHGTQFTRNNTVHS